ncbi:hypothetical protein PCE1_004614 [Barthelona sp. PCE]
MFGFDSEDDDGQFSSGVPMFVPPKKVQKVDETDNGASVLRFLKTIIDEQPSTEGKECEEFDITAGITEWVQRELARLSTVVVNNEEEEQREAEESRRKLLSPEERELEDTYRIQTNPTIHDLQKTTFTELWYSQKAY